jgi:hypothetical protein
MRKKIEMFDSICYTVEYSMAKIMPFEYSTVKIKITVQYSEFLAPLGKALTQQLMKYYSWEILPNR